MVKKLSYAEKPKNGKSTKNYLVPYTPGLPFQITLIARYYPKKAYRWHGTPTALHLHALLPPKPLKPRVSKPIAGH